MGLLLGLLVGLGGLSGRGGRSSTLVQGSPLARDCIPAAAVKISRRTVVALRVGALAVAVGAVHVVVIVTHDSCTDRLT